MLIINENGLIEEDGTTEEMEVFIIKLSFDELLNLMGYDADEIEIE